MKWNTVPDKVASCYVSASTVREWMHKSKPKESYAISNWYHSALLTTVQTQFLRRIHHTNFKTISLACRVRIDEWRRQQTKNSLFILFRYSSDNMFGGSIFFFFFQRTHSNTKKVTMTTSLALYHATNTSNYLLWTIFRRIMENSTWI